MTHARQADNTPVTLPDDNTTRQAMALDRETHPETRTTSNIATVRIRIQQVWMNVELDILSLRAALRLPAHDIFHEGIYHEFRPETAPLNDINDTDHMDDELVQI